MAETSKLRTDRATRPKKVQPALDAIDHELLRLLAGDARMTNQALAEQVGLAPSTCLLRVRNLRDSGVIRGFYADIDPAALGLDLQAMIAVKLAAHARSSLQPFVQRIRERPEVRDVYFVAGANDYLLHVAVASTSELRDFVASALNTDPDVSSTDTSLIFEHTRAARRS